MGDDQHPRTAIVLSPELAGIEGCQPGLAHPGRDRDEGAAVAGLAQSPQCGQRFDLPSSRRGDDFITGVDRFGDDVRSAVFCGGRGVPGDQLGREQTAGAPQRLELGRYLRVGWRFGAAAGEQIPFDAAVQCRPGEVAAADGDENAAATTIGPTAASRDDRC